MTIDKYGDVKTMAFGALVCIPFVLSLFVPAFNENPQGHDKSWIFSEWFVYTLILMTSLLNGLGEGAAQTAQGKYVADCATEEIKGFYFSFFWACFMGSQVVGNLISAFVLGNFD